MLLPWGGGPGPAPWGQDGHSTHRPPGPRKAGQAGQAGQAAILGAYETAGVPTVPPRRPELQPSVPIRGREAAPQEGVFSHQCVGVARRCHLSGASSPAHVAGRQPVDPSGLSSRLCPTRPHGRSQRWAQSPGIWPQTPGTDTGLRHVPSWWRCLSSLSSWQVALGPPEPAVLLAVSRPVGLYLRSWWPSTPSVCFLTVGPPQASCPLVLEALPPVGQRGGRTPRREGTCSQWTALTVQGCSRLVPQR